MNLRNTQIHKSLGDQSGEGTPGPISNPEVKLASIDGTWGAAPWESRSSPRGFFYLIERIGFFAPNTVCPFRSIRPKADP